nr:MAG TPA: hypothetical protein [Caudoviricetes sp.]
MMHYRRALFYLGGAPPFSNQLTTNNGSTL